MGLETVCFKLPWPAYCGWRRVATKIKERRRRGEGEIDYQGEGGGDIVQGVLESRGGREGEGVVC